MSIKHGVKLLDELAGKGPPAGKGDRVVYNLKMFLNRGDEVPLNAIQAKNVPESQLRTVNGYCFVDHTATLGRRQAITAVEHTLLGMRAGGYRRVRAGPHLAFAERGLPDLIPANAVLDLEIWLREIGSDS